MSNLDRALCERLGIEPKREWFRSENADGSWGESQTSLSYPALSTTGDGMVLLMEALKKANCETSITVWTLTPIPSTNKNHWYATIQNPITVGLTARHDASAPMALALAAAAALGIEVQP